MQDFFDMRDHGIGNSGRFSDPFDLLGLLDLADRFHQGIDGDQAEAQTGRLNNFLKLLKGKIIQVLAFKSQALPLHPFE